MSDKKPGLVRGFFSLIGKMVAALRWLINILFLVILVTVVVNLFTSGVQPVPDQAALKLAPSGVLVEERRYSDPLTQLLDRGSRQDAETPVRDLVVAIDGAAADPRITALVLELDHLMGGGIAKLQAVGEALDRFRDSGKPVIATGNNFSQSQYYLASYADEIHLNPMGGVLIRGFGHYNSYLKSAADKLDINIHVFKAGDYKSAVEPFTRDDMSPEARDNTESWLNQLWLTYTNQVEALRKLAKGTLNDYAATMHTKLAAVEGDLAQLALSQGLVDRISSAPEVERRLVELVGSAQDGYRHIGHKGYLANINLRGIGRGDEEKDKIGLIIASGTILDGEHPAGTIGGDTLSDLLEQARQDPDLKALVLRIDTPGGSAFAAEQIRTHLRETKQHLPVVVSMGSVAASGGYWIAAGADEIWAMPTTITGSVGVFGIVPSLEDTLASMGIHSDGVGTTPLADSHRLDRPLSPEAAAIVQLSVDHIYNRFLRLVAEGRQLSPETVAGIAEGRIWTGTQAKDIGLVDGLGTLDDALAAAANRAGLDQWSLKRISRPMGFHERLLQQLAGGTAQLQSALLPASSAPQPVFDQGRRLVRELRDIARLNDPQGIYLHCFSCIAPEGD